AQRFGHPARSAGVAERRNLMKRTGAGCELPLLPGGSIRSQSRNALLGKEHVVERPFPENSLEVIRKVAVAPSEITALPHRILVCWRCPVDGNHARLDAARSAGQVPL